MSSRERVRVDVITPATLKDYEAGLDAKGIPHEMKLNCVCSLH